MCAVCDFVICKRNPSYSSNWDLWDDDPSCLSHFWDGFKPVLVTEATSESAAAGAGLSAGNPSVTWSGCHFFILQTGGDEPTQAFHWVSQSPVFFTVHLWFPSSFFSAYIVTRPRILQRVNPQFLPKFRAFSLPHNSHSLLRWCFGMVWNPRISSEGLRITAQLTASMLTQHRRGFQQTFQARGRQLEMLQRSIKSVSQVT